MLRLLANPTRCVLGFVITWIHSVGRVDRIRIRCVTAMVELDHKTVIAKPQQMPRGISAQTGLQSEKSSCTIFFCPWSGNSILLGTRGPLPQRNSTQLFFVAETIFCEVELYVSPSLQQAVFNMHRGTFGAPPTAGSERRMPVRFCAHPTMQICPHNTFIRLLFQACGRWC